MTIVFVFFLVAVGASLCGVLAFLCDGSKLQPSPRETLLRHCDEQHAAIMRGDEQLGVYGKYPPADLYYEGQK